jgi:acyl carrier protein
VSEPAGPVSVEEVVVRTVAEILGLPKEQVDRRSRLVEDLGADSLDIIEMVMELEEEYDLTIPETDLKRLQTVDDVITYLQERAKGQG